MGFNVSAEQDPGAVSFTDDATQQAIHSIALRSPLTLYPGMAPKEIRTSSRSEVCSRSTKSKKNRCLHPLSRIVKDFIASCSFGWWKMNP
jgi:hypothetical protein